VAVWHDRTLTLGERRVVLTSYGYLFFFVGAVVTAILAAGAKVVFVLGGTLIFAALFHREALRLFLRWQLLFFVLLTFCSVPLSSERRTSLCGA